MNQKHIQGTIARYGYEEYNGRNTFFLVLSNEQGQEMPAVRGKGLEEAFQKIPDLKQGDRVNLKDFGIDENTKKRMWEIERHEPYQDLKNEIEFDHSPYVEEKINVQVENIQVEKTKESEQLNEKLFASKKIDVEDEYLPDSIKHHYIGIKKNTLMGDEKINYYDKSDPDKISIAFEDRKKSLNTSRQDDKTVSAMLDLAESKGWTAIKLKGTEEFKQKAWLEATLRGIKTKGYEPSERDLAELQIKQEARTYNQVEVTEVKEKNILPQQPIQAEVVDIPAYHNLDREKQDQAYLERIGADFAGVKMDRMALNFDETRENAKNFTGKELTNFHSGITATISGNALNKMLSSKAYEKSFDLRTHLIAVSNADKLFENAVFGWQSDDKNGNRSTNAVHRAIAPLKINDEIYLAKLTVKAFENEVDGNRVYSVEAIELENDKSPIPEMVADDIKYNARTDRLNRALIDIVVENAQKYNMEKAKNQENLQNLDLVEHKQSLPKAPEESEPEKSVQDAQKDVMKLLTDNLKNDTIHSREDLIKIFTENGYAVAKENKKSVVFQLPNSEQTFKLTDEVLAKKMERIQSEQAKNLLKMQEQLKPDAIKERYPNMNNVTIAQVTIYREYLENRYQEKPKALLEALTTLDNAVKDVASGKELVIPAIPANDVQPSVEIRTPERGNLSRNR